MQKEFNPREYWEKRAKKYGIRSVSYLDKVYCDYEEHLRRRAFYKTIEIYPKMKILDVGCGTGNWSIDFAKKGAIVTGIDISSEMIKMAKKNAEKEKLDITFLNIAAENMNFPPDSFDLVVSITSLQHIIDLNFLKQAISNIIKVTKKEGNMLILENSPITKESASQFYIVCRTRQEWIDLFGEKGATLIKEKEIPRCLKLINKKLHIKVEKDAEVECIFSDEDYDKNKEISNIFNNLFDLVEMLALQISKPFDYYLDKVPFVKRFFDLRVLLFKNMRDEVL